MRKIKVGMSMNLTGCRVEDEIEVEDDATPEQVEEELREWAMGHIDYWSEPE